MIKEKCQKQMAKEKEVKRRRKDEEMTMDAEVIIRTSCCLPHCTVGSPLLKTTLKPIHRVIGSA